MKFMLDNVLCLCRGCHYAWHREPLEAAAWLKTAVPESLLLRLDLAARASRFMPTDLSLVRLALEQEAVRYAATLPPPPRVTAIRTLKARRPR